MEGFRGLSKPVAELVTKVKHRKMAEEYPESYRNFRPNRFMKLTTRYPEKFLVTRYQTVKLDEMALEMAQAIISESLIGERELVARFSESVDEYEIRLFVSKVLQVNALDLIKEVQHATS